MGVKRLLALAGLTLGALSLLGIVHTDPTHSSPQLAAAASRLPDLDQETPTGLRVARSGSSYRLGFQSAVRNVGGGPLIIDGRRPSLGSTAMTADQLLSIGTSTQRVANVGELRYVRSSDHQHWQLLGFDRYELRRAGEAIGAVPDHKTGFCLGDRYRMSSRVLPNTPGAKVYRTNCGKNVRLKPRNIKTAATRAQTSGYSLPEILGHQKWMPPR